MRKAMTFIFLGACTFLSCGFLQAQADAPPPSPTTTPVAQTQNNPPVNANAQDDAESKRADNEERINELQQDIDGLQETVESLQGDIDQLSNCSGIGAAICEAGAAKIRRDQNKAKREISDKQREIASLRADDSSAATADSSDPVAGGSYSGPNSSEVQSLLSKSPTSWSCPSSVTELPSAQPIKPSSLPCMRDEYVWAALLEAWAAECHSRLKMESEAEQNAGQVKRYLNTVKSLCSNRPAVASGSSCSTFSIFSCTE